MTAAAGTEQRRCARGTWCKSSEIITDADGQAVRRGGLTPTAFCIRDRDDIGRCLGEMPRQYVHLQAELGNPGHRGHLIRIPFGPRVPLRVDIDALMRLMDDILSSWHERVAGVARLHFPDADVSHLLGHGAHASRQRRGGYAVREAAKTLGLNLDALLALRPEPMARAFDLRDLASLPSDTDGIVRSVYASIWLSLSGESAGLEILHLHHLARSILGETKPKPTELTGVPCRADGCGLRALALAEPPSDPADPGYWSECMACGDRMTEPDYRDWVALCAAYERNTRRAPVLENLPSYA